MVAEALAIMAVADRLEKDPRLGHTVAELKLNAGVGRTVWCSGVGKSGHVAHHLADKLASIHVPASFLCPMNALHGDLGRVHPHDSAILISRSGTCAEIVRLAETLRKRAPGMALIALTADPSSPMAAVCDYVLDCEAGEEACPHNFVPTVSTAVAFAVADALVLTLMAETRFSPASFLETHPGGALGKRAGR